MTHAINDWGLFALLAIDVQQDFWGESNQKNFPRFPSNLARLLSWCRGQGLEVVHLRAGFRSDRSDWMVRYRLFGRIPCVEGTPGITPGPEPVCWILSDSASRANSIDTSRCFREANSNSFIMQPSSSLTDVLTCSAMNRSTSSGMVSSR